MKSKSPISGKSLAELRPDLTNQWHPTRNGHLTPFDVTPGSNRRVWWKCPKGDDHEWLVSVGNRNAGWGCPCCSGKKIVKSNSLATINPTLAKQWHPTKNGSLTPFDVTANSDRKVWWKCPKGDDHEWVALIKDRNNGIGCAICSNYKVVESNCLQTLNPELAKQWHPTKNGKLTPKDVHPGSAKKVWWKCPNGDDHEWLTVIHSRSNGRGCPVCSGHKVSNSTSLATLNPQLARQWHPTKNGKLTPADVRIGSGRKIWWKCPEGQDHEWRATVHNRSIGLNCPVCSNQKVTISNCLATLNPELAKQWHPTKNSKLTPFDVGAGSGKIIWWKCPKGDDHEWRSSVARRKAEINCPICIGRRVVKSNSLATLNAELASEWHPTKNSNLTPYQVRPGSILEVWWQCSKNADHIWKTSIKDRSSGTGCPICSNKMVNKDNCLATINPELAKYWHPTKNGILTPYDVTPGSSLKVWWQCPKGQDHEWEATVQHRTNDRSCPICLNQKIVLSNCLATLNPDLAAQWHPTKNNKLTPYDVGAGSDKKVWWKCPKGDDHEWITGVVKRKNGRECPVCSGKKAVGSNCLATLKPFIAKQWHPTKNGDLTPFNVTISSGKRVWWQCPKVEDHVWRAAVSDRTIGTGCPKCNGPTSFPELRIYCELKSIFPSTLHREKIDGYEIDIFIPELQIGIEYDGQYWHKDKLAIDQTKTNALESKLLLIRVREKELPQLGENNIHLKTNKVSINTIKKILNIMLKYRNTIPPELLENIQKYLETKDWVSSSQFEKLQAEKTFVTYEKSLSYLFPDIAKEWHPTRNGLLLPENVSPSSNKKIWWLNRRGREWQMTIASRSRKQQRQTRPDEPSLFDDKHQNNLTQVP